MRKDARVVLARLTAPFGFLSASSLPTHLVLGLGLAAMTALTVADLRAAIGVWLTLCLWCCLAWFAIESAVRLSTAFVTGRVRRYLLSPACWIDVLSVFPVPIALVCGSAPPTAWLFRRCGFSNWHSIRRVSPSLAACSCSRRNRSRACWCCF